MNKEIGIIGCGWLGFPLAENFIASGYQVKGTTTSKEKLDIIKKVGIKAFMVQLQENGILGNINDFLNGLDILIVNVPPGIRKNKTVNFVQKMKFLLVEIAKSGIKNMVFVSSTSVYGNVTGKITEKTPPQPESESGKQLLECEKLFMDHPNLNTTVVRFGGLIGRNRHPVKFLAGKKDLKNGDERINLIHGDDCIRMIKTIVEHNYWNAIFNGVYPLHPKKQQYYSKEAQKRGLEIPEFVHGSRRNNKKNIISRNYLNNCHYFYTSIIS